jgi:hypothetical protein
VCLGQCAYRSSTGTWRATLNAWAVLVLLIVVSLAVTLANLAGDPIWVASASASVLALATFGIVSNLISGRTGGSPSRTGLAHQVLRYFAGTSVRLARERMFSRRSGLLRSWGGTTHPAVRGVAEVDSNPRAARALGIRVATRTVIECCGLSVPQRISLAKHAKAALDSNIAALRGEDPTAQCRSTRPHIRVSVEWNQL